MGAGTSLDDDDGDDRAVGHDDYQASSVIWNKKHDGKGKGCQMCPEGWTSIGGFPKTAICYINETSSSSRTKYGKSFGVAFSVRKNPSSASPMHIHTYATAVGYALENHLSSIPITSIGALIPVSSLRVLSVDPLDQPGYYTANFYFHGSHSTRSALMHMIDRNSNCTWSSPSNNTGHDGGEQMMDICMVAFGVHPEAYMLEEIHSHHEFDHRKAKGDYDADKIFGHFHRRHLRPFPIPTPKPLSDYGLGDYRYRGYYRDVGNLVRFTSKFLT